MIQFPNAKINLGLSVVGKRPDGYHNLETVFYPVAMYDALEFVEAGETTFHSSGRTIAGDLQDNLVWKAYHLLKNDFPSLPELQIHLLKRIPMGAGLGGGSADAAFMLRMLNEFGKLGLGTGRLIEYSASLGSDCPFFILNTPCFATGRGEQLSPIGLDLAQYQLVLLLSEFHVNTRTAFSMIRPSVPTTSIADIVMRPVPEWRDNLHNDFEEPVFAMHPVLGEIKEAAYEAGAVYSAMSGSGSTIFAIVERDVIAMFKSAFEKHPVRQHVAIFYC